MSNCTSGEAEDGIPLADADPQCVLSDEPATQTQHRSLGCSMDSLESSCSGSSAPSLQADIADDQEEKARLISQVLELQNTLDDLSQRVDSVKEENLKLRSENQVLGQYIDNLMSASSVFHATSAPLHK